MAIPFGVNLKSALSERNNSLYSARLVNILYGSVTPLLTKSSIKTPIYASDRDKMNSSFFNTFSAAFTPAIIPCAAASSYPVVPLI